MQLKITVLDKLSFPANAYLKLIDTYTKDQALKQGTQLHAHLIINGLARSVRFASKLIGFYTECNCFVVVRKLFNEIPKSNIRGWVALIGSCARNGYHRETMYAFDQMKRQGIKYDKIVIPSVLKSCGQLWDRKTGEKIHAVVLRHEFESDAFVMCALIDMYSKCGLLEKAKRTFDLVVEKDLAVLNAMISGYIHQGRVQDAWNLVEEMRFLELKPDLKTWNALISGFSRANDQKMVIEIFRIMESYGSRPDVISWTSLISGLVQNLRIKEAFGVFQQMLKFGVLPTASTISSLLPACSGIADLRHGVEIHGYAVVMGFEEDVYVRSAIIDMYAKSGFIHEAKSLFKKMPRRSTVTWNSMIFGYANHGYCHEAVQLFRKMLEEDEIKIDHLTFTAVFTACANAGMADLGEELFKLMQEKYEIVPRLEHYACVVDMLGRSGKIDEAYEVIKKMQIEPDLFVWGAFLGACRQHGCLDLAEVAAKELDKLEPKSVGSSMVLFDLYANYNSWENAVKLQKIIKKKKLKSFPGRSWIEAS